ncbi:MAG: elongation factor G [bacterium]|nr:elongation factor G [bacterium]
MKIYPTEQIRNVGIFGHQGSGKTSLTEAMLYVAGHVDRLGKVDEGHATTDFDPDEISKKISVFSALAPVEWKDTKINIIDTPGFFDFVAENIAAMRVTEGAILVGAANSGLEVGLEKNWDLCEKNKKVRILFVNKMDKENANFQHFIDECHEKLKGTHLVPLQIPIGAAENFSGVIDLVAQKAYKYDAKGVATEIPIPASCADDVASWREKLTEAAAEADDALMEKYFETMELSDEEIVNGLQTLIHSGSLAPVFCGSSATLAGISTLMDAIAAYIPAPTASEKAKDAKDAEIILEADPKAPAAALIFKTSSDPYVGKISYMRVFSGTVKSDSTLYNLERDCEEKLGSLLCMRGKNQEKIAEAQAGDIVEVGRLGASATGETLSENSRKVKVAGIDMPKSFYSRAIGAKSKADEDKLSANLQRVMQEDPTLSLKRVEETHQAVLSGIGDMQLSLVVERLKRMGVEVELSDVKIPYRETMRGKVSHSYRHKKQAGGRGQFGEVHVEFEGLPRGSGFVFEDAIVGGVISKNFIPAVEKGIAKTMSEGVLSGNPMVDVKARLFFGKMHDVDSSDAAFQMAGSMCFKEAVRMPEAKPVILEPIVNVEVIVPDAYMGDVIGDLNSKRGKIQGMDPAEGGLQCIKAQVPQSEMMNYAIDLRSITQGRGDFTMEFDHYEDAPREVADKIISEYEAAKAAK